MAPGNELDGVILGVDDTAADDDSAAGDETGLLSPAEGVVTVALALAVGDEGAVVEGAAVTASDGLGVASSPHFPAAADTPFP